MALAPIPLRTPIVDQQGRINIFFRERWQELLGLTAVVPAVGLVSFSNQSAALATKVIATTKQTGIYRVTFTARRTVVDGVASTLQFTWHWTDGGSPFSQAGTLDNTDTTGHLYSETKAFPADQNSDLTFDMAYTSNTPAAMKYKLAVFAELVSL